jgi:hypothetical protein
MKKIEAREERAKRLKAIASVLDLYLKNNIREAKKLAAEWKVKFTSPDDAPPLWLWTIWPVVKA